MKILLQRLALSLLRIFSLFPFLYARSDAAIPHAFVTRISNLTSGMRMNENSINVFNCSAHDRERESGSVYKPSSIVTDHLQLL